MKLMLTELMQGSMKVFWPSNLNPFKVKRLDRNLDEIQDQSSCLSVAVHLQMVQETLPREVLVQWCARLWYALWFES